MYSTKALLLTPAARSAAALGDVVPEASIAALAEVDVLPGEADVSTVPEEF